MSFIVTHYGELSKALDSYIAVSGEAAMMPVRALWDTSSAQSCISNDVVKLIDPIRKSKEKTASAEGDIVKEMFSISISISDEITFRDVTVEKKDLSEKGVDMLIGMDIISRGDFEVRNYNGLTQFAFRIPPRNEPIKFE